MLRRNIRCNYDGSLSEVNLTPVRAIRYKCIDCSENQTDRLECEFITCSLYPYRDGKKGKMPKGTVLFKGFAGPPLEPERTGDRLTPIKAIHYHCLFCMGGYSRNASNEVKLCIDYICPIYDYRLGTRPQEKQ